MDVKGTIGLGLGAVALLAAVSVGCSSSDKEDASPSASSTTVESTTERDSSVGSASGAAEAATSEATGVAVLGDGEAPAERTIAMTDTAFTPSSLTIGKGENVTFKAADDGIYAVIVGSLDGATVTGGLIETFDFPEAGTYPISEDINGYRGTITVK